MGRCRHYCLGFMLFCIPIQESKFCHLCKFSCFGSVQELCGKGGVLFLAQAILKLNTMPRFVASARIVAAVSRLKAKILSIVSPRDESILFQC